MITLVLISQICFALAAVPPEATVEQGHLVGKYETTLNNRKIAAFLGVPYAEPPVGKNRLEEPKPARKWTGTYNATVAPVLCLQYSHLNIKGDPVVGSEDCLYLNVYTPQVPNGSGNKLLNVIVVIHAGSFMYFGSSFYGPGVLLDKDVVLVTLNFRLGPLGFLSTEDSALPGNYGLKDQLLALRWIKKNIENFGGDPNRITLAGGASAGAACVHYHLLSPLSKGLFTRAISMSGTALCPWALAKNSKEKASALAAALGCPTGDSAALVTCLKSRPAERIVALSKLFMPWMYSPASPFGPVVEPTSSSAFIPEHPLKAIVGGKSAQVPWLLSFTADEGLYPGSEILGKPRFVKDLESDWEELLPHLLDYNFTLPRDQMSSVASLIKEYYEVDLRSQNGRNNLVKMLGDRLYLTGIIEALKLHAQHYKSPIFLYQFSYRGADSATDVLTETKDNYGVCHGDDMLYILPMPWFTVRDDNDKLMCDTMTNIWATFAEKGTLDWTSAKENLPLISFTSIKDGNTLEFAVARDLANEDFWQSLGLQENLLSGMKKDEL